MLEDDMMMTMTGITLTCSDRWILESPSINFVSQGLANSKLFWRLVGTTGQIFQDQQIKLKKIV
jgi:hypothetical protein